MIIAPAVAPPRFIAADRRRSLRPSACCSANEPMVAAWPQVSPGLTSRPSRSCASRPASSSASRTASTAKPTALGPYTLPCSVMPSPAIATFAVRDAMCALYGSDDPDLKQRRREAMSALRISIELPVHGVTFAQVRELARACEAAGLDGVWVPDHLVSLRP